MDTAFARYRATGADLPGGDPRGAHPGVALEGWFWRVSDPASGRVVIAILGVTRPPDGPPWGMVTLATRGHVAVGSGPVLRAATRGVDVVVGAGAEGAPPLLLAGPGGLSVRLGEADRLALGWTGAGADWPRRAYGGVGPAHWVPGLSQYWHPWRLGGAAHGDAVLDGAVIPLDGGRIYAEKNWGGGGMPPSWWWGQAGAFADPDVCVAFAGGRAGLGPVQVTSGALVVRVGARLFHVVRPPLLLRGGHAGEGGLARFALRGVTAAGTLLTVEARADSASAVWLPVPVPGTREHRPGHTAQALDGTLRLTVRRRGRVLYSGESGLAGLEEGRGISSAA